eukprot:1732952-Prymnesium_polylepis.1
MGVGWAPKSRKCNRSDHNNTAAAGQRGVVWASAVGAWRLLLGARRLSLVRGVYCWVRGIYCWVCAAPVVGCVGACGAGCA